MITRLKVDGFKSLDGFEMEFAPFTVIAGANGAGKSNIFDALRLISRLVNEDLKTSFKDQRGDPDELFTAFDDGQIASEIYFEVDLLVPRKVLDSWGGEATLRYPRLRYSLRIQRTEGGNGIHGLQIRLESLERIKPTDDLWAKQYLGKRKDHFLKSEVGGGSPRPFISTERLDGGQLKYKLRQDGGTGGRDKIAASSTRTVISGVNSVEYIHALAAKNEIVSWQFLQLNPEELREPTRQDVGMQEYITEGGSNLAAALYRIQLDEAYAMTEISRRLNDFLPGFVRVEVVDDKASRQFQINLVGDDGRVFSQRVLSEGTLRILALCVMYSDPAHQGLLCFEEPENGIHPFRISILLNLLLDLSSSFEDDDYRQVIINTHSPRLLESIRKHAHLPQIKVFFTDIVSIFGIGPDGIKKRMKVTRPTEVPLGAQLSMLPSDRRTLEEVAKYLGVNDLEATRSELLQ